jgi:hypothetical protein
MQDGSPSPFAARDTGETLIRGKLAGWERLGPVRIETLLSVRASWLDEPYVRELTERLIISLAAINADHH